MRAERLTRGSTRRGIAVVTVCLLTGCLLIGCGSPEATDRGATDEEPARPLAARALDPACADPLANVPGALELPPGVAADPRDREAVLAAAPGWDLPSGVTFTVGEPRLEGDRLTLRGELVNATGAPQTVMLSEAGAGVFTATLVGPGLVRRTATPSAATEPGVTPPPALFPEPRAFTLGPGARWALETTVVVACWEPPPERTVTAHWWLTVEGEGLQGDVPVALGPAAPPG